MPTFRPGAKALAALLGGAGAAHFLVPAPFDAIVPRVLPGKPRTWTRLSGVAEIALATAVAHPRTRRRASLATAAFFVAVFPANVRMARDWRGRPAPLRYAANARLPLQVPLVWWALHTAREADRPG
ncbi:hypothetical protein WDH52_24335 [Streptomyces sp. TRM70308]|uniref:DoxX family protein n=1 Tax=Streptomyces sp. TRM70308 TaxID=3131932 RepID=UPI003CFBED6F